MIDERQRLLLIRTAGMVASADYLCYQRDSLIYECIKSGISSEVLSKEIGLAVQRINTMFHDHSIRLEEAS